MLDVPKSNMVNEDDGKGVSNPIVYRLVLTGGRFLLEFLFNLFRFNIYTELLNRKSQQQTISCSVCLINEHFFNVTDHTLGCNCNDIMYACTFL